MDIFQNVESQPTILIFAPSVNGGVAEYVFYQALELKKTGCHVEALVSPSFLAGRFASFKTITCLSDPPPANSCVLTRKFRLLWRTIANRWVLAWHVLKRRPSLVLLDSYAEYFAPLWVWPHWLLARMLGVCYAANLHDPVRNYQVGPAWWHKLSVRLAYLPLDFVLVHEKLGEPSPVPSSVRVVQVPHGLYEINKTAFTSSKIREEWGVKCGQKVFLAFGYVRDGKNLDLAIRSLARVPEAFLVVRGSVAASKDKPFAYYRQLAEQTGVLTRCHFEEGFVADAELGKYFVGADFVLLTYSSSFHAQSGVLNLAARARKPVLASASASPLLESVRRFNLGVSVEPDSTDAIITGMRRLLSSPPSPQWEDYEAFASWAANVQGLLHAAGLETPIPS